MKKVNLIFLIYCFFILCNESQAQLPSYDLIVQNFQTQKFGGNSILFDIYLIRNGSINLKYAGGQYFFDFYSAVANGGTLTYKIIESNLPPALRPRNPSIVNNNNGTSRLGLDINTFPGSGNGYFIPEGLPGINIMTMLLSTSAPRLLIRYDDPWGVHTTDLRLRYTQTPADSSTQIYSYMRHTESNITNPSRHFIDSTGLRVYPVEMISFISEINENKVLLRWVTASELNNSGFDLQRKSQSEEAWVSIGFIRGYGTTSEPKYYTFIDRVNAGIYNYRLKQIDYNGNYEFFDLNGDVLVGTPSKYKLLQNYPNPFNPNTVISYQLAASSFTSLKVYDLLGKEVAILVNEKQDAGYYNYQLSNINYQLTGGIYFFRLDVDNKFIDTKRMILLK